MDISHFGNSEIVLRAPSMCNARGEFVILTGGEDYNASSLLAQCYSYDVRISQ